MPEGGLGLCCMGLGAVGLVLGFVGPQGTGRRKEASFTPTPTLPDPNLLLCVAGAAAEVGEARCHGHTQVSQVGAQARWWHNNGCCCGCPDSSNTP